ncbi:MAG: hypothetical protein [Bacteriophage sp.]|nr:MAG: hypothetical protein [Bacteriophage sp.]
MTKLTTYTKPATYNGLPDQTTRSGVRPKAARKGRKKQPTSYAIGKQHFETMYKSGILPGCSKGFLYGACGNGHEFLKNVVCSKEFCADCGKDGSPIHSTRIDRWNPKVRALNEKAIGVLVVTIPEELRNEFTYPGYLSNFRTALKNKLKKLGYDRGLMRWHLFGDCKECKGKGCAECFNTGAGKVYKPHLNIIINGAYIPNIYTSEMFTEIQTFLKTYFKQRHGYSTDKALNIHYSYKNTPEKIAHIVKYITRSTHRIYNAEIAEHLHNYRLTTVWGTWKDAKAITEGEKLVDNICVCCDREKKETNNKIHWLTLNNNNKAHGRKLSYLENGFFHLQAANVHGNDSTHTRIQNANRRAIERNIRPVNLHALNG